MMAVTSIKVEVVHKWNTACICAFLGSSDGITDRIISYRGCVAVCARIVEITYFLGNLNLMKNIKVTKDNKKNLELL